MFSENSTQKLTYTDELISLFIYGSNSNATLDWLEGRLKAEGVEKLRKPLHDSCTQITSLIIDHLEPASQRLLFSLNELHNSSIRKQKLEKIGLDSKELKLMISMTSFFMAKVEKLKLSVSRYNKLFSTFCNWLMIVLKGRELSDLMQDMQAENELQIKEQLRQCALLRKKLVDDSLVLEFLSVDWLSSKDAVSQLLEMATVEMPQDESSFSISSLYSSELSNCFPPSSNSLSSVSVSQMYALLERKKSETLSKPSEAFSRLIQLKKEDLLYSCKEKSPLFDHRFNVSHKLMHLLYYNQHSKGKITLF